MRSGRPAAPARRPPPPPKASAPQAEDTLVSLIDVDRPSRPAPSRPKSGDGPPVRAAPPVPKAPEVTGGLLDLGAPMDQVQGEKGCVGLIGQFRSCFAFFVMLTPTEL